MIHSTILFYQQLPQDCLSRYGSIGYISKSVDGNILDLYIIDNYWGSYGLKSIIDSARYFVMYENLWFSHETSLQEKIKIP